MREFFLIVVLVLLLGVAAVALFGIQKLGLPKMAESAIAALLMLALMGLFNPLLKGLTHERQEDKPEQHFS
jgi:hypothetical protein